MSMLTLSPSFKNRTLADSQKEIIEKYAGMVDSDYAKPEPPVDDAPSNDGTTTAAPSEDKPIDGQANDDDQKGCAGKDGFFKNAFGKIKDKLSSDEDDDSKKKKE